MADPTHQNRSKILRIDAKGKGHDPDSTISIMTLVQIECQWNNSTSNDTVSVVARQED